VGRSVGDTIEYKAPNDHVFTVEIVSVGS
jgi:transcription elongation GreA/GreB family factor